MNKFISAFRNIKLRETVALQETFPLIFFKGIGLLLLIAAVFFAPLFGLYYIIRRIVRFFDTRVYNGKIDLRYAELLLSSKFVYYQKLDDKSKTKFLRRLLNFIDNKDFKGSGGLELTDEMIVLISASAIQLTFGLDEYRLDHFSRIFVYPKAYYSKISGQYHKGETNLAGAIALSWNHFTEGYSKPNDKINLGLHEMAHALRFDKFKSDAYDKFFNTYYDKWQVIAKEEYKRTKEKGSVFFREYGGTNLNEFFAVCVESFFESPSEFKKAYPDIYRHMCILLNQDPLSDFLSTGSENTIRSMHHPENMNITGEPFYISGNNTRNVLGLLFAAIVWLCFTISNIAEGINLEIILFSLLLLGVGYTITIRAFSKVCFYDKGVIIRSLVPNIIEQKKELSYDEIICVDFDGDSYDESNDAITVIFLYKGKIKERTFNDNFTPQEVIKFADILHARKVAVKLNKFYKFSSRN